MRARTPVLFAGLCGLTLLTPGCDVAPASPAFHTAETIGAFDDPDGVLVEVSGLAASLRTPGALWLMNDGDAPVLFAVDGAGKRVGRVMVTHRGEPLELRDVEDLASFTLNDTHYLLIADVGDNPERRKRCVLHIVREPSLAPDEPTSVEVAWSIPFAYEGGATDVEAAAVDTSRGEVILLSKRQRPHPFHIVSLHPPDADRSTARPMKHNGVARMFDAAPLPTDAEAQSRTPLGRYRAQPTALDISPDGRMALVLCYGGAFVFERTGDEAWAAALGRAPVHVVLPEDRLGQAEAAAWTADGTAFLVTTETQGEHDGRPPPLVRVRRQIDGARR